MSYAGRERANGGKIGVPGRGTQRRAARPAVAGRRYLLGGPSDAGAGQPRKRRACVRRRDAVHFAWYGPNTPEKAFGYRVIGDGFVIEMGSVDEAAQHLHTIYHDLGNVLGRAA